jgi:hypothetical protein
MRCPRFQIFQTLHRWLYRLEFWCNLPEAHRAKRAYRAAILAVTGHEPRIRLECPNEAVFTLTVPYLPSERNEDGRRTAIEQIALTDRIHDYVEARHPHLIGHVILEPVRVYTD